MGCGESKHGTKSNAVKREGVFKLDSCKLSFSNQQLSRLNFKFDQLLSREYDQGEEKGRKTNYLNIVVERLIQRMICNVGTFDARFASAFLVDLEPLKHHDFEATKRRHKFKYLVRMDLLSTPAIYPNFFEPPIRIIEDESFPQGFAKIRVHGEFLEQWMGFIDSKGFLRRDKIQKRFLELLARAAAKPTEPVAPGNVDESRLCGSPGKIVDPITLNYILKTPPSYRFYFGSAERNESRFPDPRDFRIAIIEGFPEIRLHISFLSPGVRSISTKGEIEVSLILGIGVAGWPLLTDFPFRLPLDHVDVILGYRAAQLDYYLVPKGPHTSVYCEDRTALWEIRTLATEMFLQHHYSPTSLILRVYKVLVYLQDILRARGMKSVNRYILKNSLFYELETNVGMMDWAPQLASRRILSILDRLLNCFRSQHFPSYIFPEKNLLLQDDVFEEDYASDGDILETYLKLLQAGGCHVELNGHDCDFSKDIMENVMLQKWEEVISGMMPPASNRSVRLAVTLNNSSMRIIYTRQQIEYIALLLREVLKVKRIQRRGEKARNDENDRQCENKKIAGKQFDYLAEKNKEDFLYLLRVIFVQAKENLISTVTPRLIKGKRIDFNKLEKMFFTYDISTSMIIDDVKRNEEMNFDFTDDVSIVVKILECLYKAIDSDGKVLGRVLRPYMTQIFKGSHENCWFLAEWKKTNDVSEIQVMEVYGSLVMTEKIDPLDGLINAASKGWNWAMTTLKILRAIAEETSTNIIMGKTVDSSKSGLRLIFAPEPQKTVRINLTLLDPIKKDTEKEVNGANGSQDRKATIRSFQDLLKVAITTNTAPINNERRFSFVEEASHLVLRNENPFTAACMEMRRQGHHRGLGSIVQALISLQKLTVLQEISQFLPENEKTRVLSDIKKLSKEIERLAIDNHKNNCFSRAGKKKNRFSFKKYSERRGKISEDAKQEKCDAQKIHETYRSRGEFVLRRSQIFTLPKVKKDNLKKKEPEEKKETLLDTCRVLKECHRLSHYDSLGLNTFTAKRNVNIGILSKPSTSSVDSIIHRDYTL